MQSNNKITIIGISGPTRSGKSTLTNSLKGQLNANIIHQDHFFDQKKIYQQLKGNWETPEAIKWEEFYQTIKEQILNTEKNGKKYLIIEGFLLFHDKTIEKLCDLKIFLNLSESDIYKRRMKTKPVPNNYFHTYLIPGYKNYLQTVQKIKNLFILDGTLEKSELLQKSRELIFSSNY